MSIIFHFHEERVIEIRYLPPENQSNFKEKQLFWLKTSITAKNNPPPPYILQLFSSKTKQKFILQSVGPFVKKSAATPPPPPVILILLKFIQNAPNRKNVEATKFEGFTMNGFRMTADYMITRASEPPPLPPYPNRVKDNIIKLFQQMALLVLISKI